MIYSKKCTYNVYQCIRQICQIVFKHKFCLKQSIIITFDTYINITSPFLYMGKARHFKTFPRATYQKFNFSLDLFLQLYFKIRKLFVLVLKNWDTKYITSILIIFSNKQLKGPKTHTEYVTFYYSLNIFQNILNVLGIFVQILYRIKTCTIKYNNVISKFLSVNGLDTLQYTRYKVFQNSSVFLF